MEQTEQKSEPVSETVIPDGAASGTAPGTEIAETADTGLAWKIIGIVRTILVYVLALGIVIGALLFAANNSPQKSLFGYRYYTVLTPSMTPTYNTGDMVFVRVLSSTEKESNVAVGDIITFNPSSDSEAYLTHRVTEVLPDYQGTGVTCFHTKGDANNAEDSFLIDEDRVIGTVQFHLPKLGYIVRFVQLRWYYVAALVVLLGIFFHLLRMYFAPDDDDDDKDKETE